MGMRSARLQKKQNGIDFKTNRRIRFFFFAPKKIFSFCSEFLIRSNNSCKYKRLKEAVPWGEHEVVDAASPSATTLPFPSKHDLCVLQLHRIKELTLQTLVHERSTSLFSTWHAPRTPTVCRWTLACSAFLCFTITWLSFLYFRAEA